ncbi:MAG: HdeD family acid-resistance protein [Aristaeellaceae bacterium]
MLKKAYTPLSLLLQALAMLAAGILLLVRPVEALRLAVTLLKVYLWVSAAASFLTFLTDRQHRKAALGQAGLRAALACVMMFLPQLLGKSVAYLFGAWVVINALSSLIYAAQLHHDHERGVLTSLISAAFHAVFAVALFTSPLQGVVSLALILGIYCLLNTFFLLSDMVRELLGTDVRGKRIRQRIRLSPPVLLTALLPLRLLSALDDPDEAEETACWTRQETAMEHPTKDLEIFLHLSRNTAAGLGHVDIALGDTVYSYGCYDAGSSRMMGMLSDGVLVMANRDQYIPYCLETEQKKLISFGVTLTDAQKEAVRSAAAHLLEDSVPWYPPQGDGQKAFEQAANATFHKIQHGPFKTYNVLKTNCVALANILCGASGLDLMNQQGIVTPGTYYAFLDRQFLRPHSIVISRTVYR